MSDPDDVTPFRLLSYQGASGGHGLILSGPAIEVGPAVTALEAAGRTSTGYAWAGIARSIIAKHMSEQAEAITLDPEAGMFVARAADAAVVRQLGRLMARVYRDPQALRAIVTESDPNLLD